MVGQTQTDTAAATVVAETASLEVFQEPTPAVVAAVLSDEPVESKVSASVDDAVEESAQPTGQQDLEPAAGDEIDEPAEKPMSDHPPVVEQPVAVESTADAVEVHAVVAAEEAPSVAETTTTMVEEPSVSVSEEPEVGATQETDPVQPEEPVTDGSEAAAESAREEVVEARTVTPQEEEREAPVVNQTVEVSNETTAAAGSGELPTLPQFLYTAVEKVAREQGFTPGQLKIRFDFGSNKGDGFVGEMFKAHVSEAGREEVYLCKLPPLNEARRQQFPAMAIFGRETLSYTTLLPIVYAYQEEKGISREEGFFNAPKCYLAECNEAAEESVIIMDDLRLEGYRMWNKLVPVNYEHARLAMIQLGRLHAVSYALKRDRPEEFEQFKVPDQLKLMMPEGGPFEQMMKTMIQNAMDTLEPHETVERAKMQKLLENVRAELDFCSNAALAEPHAVLGHGDCWVNNFMFRYKNGTPERIVLLDWQIARYTSPVLDIAYFIFCCTDEEFRRRHYDEMIGIYYSSLATLLERLGHNPQEVFPRTALARQLRRFGRFGLLMAVFLVPMMCTSNEDLPDMDEAAEKFRDGEELDMSPFSDNANKNAYHTRIRAVIRDIIRYGYL